MIISTKSRVFPITVLLLTLAGCAQLGVKNEPEEAKPDLLELQKHADVAYSNNDMATSEQHYLVLLQQLPDIPLHWFRLANIYVRTNRPDAAVKLYREAVLRDPKYAKAWFNLSIVQLKQSAYSLNEMLLYVDRNDPMYSKGKKLLDGIQGTIQQN